jgi:hypothetical protein
VYDGESLASARLSVPDEREKLLDVGVASVIHASARALTKSHVVNGA